MINCLFVRMSRWLLFRFMFCLATVDFVSKYFRCYILITVHNRGNYLNPLKHQTSVVPLSPRTRTRVLSWWPWAGSVTMCPCGTMGGDSGDGVQYTTGDCHHTTLPLLPWYRCSLVTHARHHREPIIKVQGGFAITKFLFYICPRSMFSIHAQR